MRQVYQGRLRVMSNIYKRAGVNVNKGYEAIKRMKTHMRRTTRREVMENVGTFAGLFDITSLHYKEPVLISGADGVVTKLIIAFSEHQYHTVGIDLVAMCINDIVAQGAKPLFFLDYIGCGKNNPEVIEQIISGIAEGCIQAGATLIGGETAEMPGMYDKEVFDLAGFAVGICERSKLITGKDISQGDIVIGLPSSGIHSNGFSLVRKVFRHLDYKKVYPGFSQPLGNILLEPTKIYFRALMPLLDNDFIKGIARITGGGFYENLPRIIPKGLGVQLEQNTWHVPHIFTFIQEQGNIALEDMYGIFNMGIGMAIVVNEENVTEALDLLHDQGEAAKVIGHITNQEGVQMV